MRLLPLLLALAGCAASASVDRAIAAADAERKEQQIPGVALVAMRGDEVIVARGLGLEDAARAHAVTPQTVFALGSIGKQFVSALVLQLVEQGSLKLDDPVTPHLPEFTRLPQGLTIRHLLSHTSGMRDLFVQPELNALLKLGTTIDDYVAVARHTPADFPPGSRWSYANINYLMLKLILERTSGQPLEKLASHRLFGPLGLHSIRYCSNQPGRTAGEARGHVVQNGKLAPHPPENFELFRSSGFCGSALDLGRWTRALATGRVIEPASYAEMTRRTRLTNGEDADFGLGMALVAPDRVQRHGHGGYGGGFSAQAAYYPSAQLTTVVLANRFVFPERIERKVARQLLGLPDPVIRPEPTSAGQRARLAGTYDVGIRGWHVRVADRDGRLWFELAAPPMKLPLLHVGGGRFVSAEDADGYRLEFSPDARELRLLGMGMLTWYGRKLAEGTTEP